MSAWLLLIRNGRPGATGPRRQNQRADLPNLTSPTVASSVGADSSSSVMRAGEEINTAWSASGEDDGGCAAAAPGWFSGGEHGAVGEELQPGGHADLRAGLDRGIQ